VPTTAGAIGRRAYFVRVKHAESGGEAASASSIVTVSYGLHFRETGGSGGDILAPLPAASNGLAVLPGGEELAAGGLSSEVQAKAARLSGWSAEKNGGGQVWRCGDLFPFPASGTADVSLYAVWR